MTKFLRFFPSIFILILAFKSYSAVPPMMGFADLVETTSPSVVSIVTTQIQEIQSHPLLQDPFFKEFFPHFNPYREDVTALGSGFIIDQQGHIVTNYHVINKATNIKIVLYDDREFEAKVVGFDERSDLALLKISANTVFKFATLGDSDKIRIGDWVVAIGNPFGLGWSVTAGIVSARARNLDSNPYGNFIQTDAPINRGNSGGPLFNSLGEVIGVNTAIISPSQGNIGIAFAIPAKQVKNIIEQLKTYGEIRRGWLGASIRTIDKTKALELGLNSPGVFVSEVVKNSPAEKGKISPGDIILKINDQKINSSQELITFLSNTSDGQKINILIWRGQKNVLLKDIVLASQPKTHSSSNLLSGEYMPELSLDIAEIDPYARQKYNIPEKIQGVWIQTIRQPGSLPNNISTGAVITHINQNPIRTIKDVKKSMEDLHKFNQKSAIFNFYQNDRIISLPLKIHPKK